MPVRKYWRHLFGVEIAVAFPDEPREKKIAFLNHICQTKEDADVMVLIDSRAKLKTEFENFKPSKSN
jgi:hypothetical protein